MDANQAPCSMLAPALYLRELGFLIVEDLFTETECDRIAEDVAASVESAAGSRALLQHAWCRATAEELRRRVADWLPEVADTAVVQCTYFHKSTVTNWLVPWHQDRSIPVAARVESSELTGWSRKEGTLFVYAPDEVLADMLAIRLHLDDSTMDNGPLRVIAGTHRDGTLSPDQIQRARIGNREENCLIGEGSVLAMRPLLLHASSKAASAAPRRVLQFLFGPPKLPHGLSWRWAI